MAVRWVNVVQYNQHISYDCYYLERNEVVLYKRHFPRAAVHQLRIALTDWVKGKYRKDPYARVKWEAFKDAWMGRMGKHKVYKPGWEIISEK